MLVRHVRMQQQTVSVSIAEQPFSATHIKKHQQNVRCGNHPKETDVKGCAPRTHADPDQASSKERTYHLKQAAVTKAGNEA